jgi:hypothetical protein
MRQNRDVNSGRLQDGEPRSLGMGQTASPVCTAIFEIIDVSTPSKTELTLAQWRGGQGARIVYDRAYPCDEQAHSVVLFLESNLRFRPARRSPFGGLYGSSLQGIPAHSLRLLPEDGCRSIPIDLPRNIVRQIVSEAVDCSTSQWRAALFSYGTIHRSWVHALDLFFVLHCQTYAVDPSSAVRVARSLLHKPERAKLMRRFTPMIYRDSNGKECQVDQTKCLLYCQAMLDILELAPMVRSIDIKSIHHSLIPGFVAALRRLRHIERCYVMGTIEPPVSPNLRCCIRIEDILASIERWSQLEHLAIDHCGEDDETKTR